MGSHFGIDDGDWDDAKRELREAILRRALNRRMTWYGEIAPEITVVHIDPYSEAMNHLLGEILEDDHREGLPLITSIVTHKNGDKEPGDGFYDKARSLNYRFAEPFVFWSTQVQRVFTMYGRPGRT